MNWRSKHRIQREAEDMRAMFDRINRGVCVRCGRTLGEHEISEKFTVQCPDGQGEFQEREEQAA